MVDYYQRWEKVGKYFGTYIRNLDSKNRLLLPSKLMGEMPSRLYLLRGFEGAISLYSEDSFQKFLSKLESLSYFDSNARSFTRLAASSVVPLDVDGHDRITLPMEIKNRYGIEQEVVIIGALDHIEVFNKKAYEEYLAKEEARFEEIADVLSKTGEKE